MFRRAVGALIVMAVSAGAYGWVSAQSGRFTVEGAWLLQEFSYAKPEATPYRLNKPVGMLLLTGNHHKCVILGGSSPRPEVGPRRESHGGSTSCGVGSAANPSRHVRDIGQYPYDARQCRKGKPTNG